MKYHDYDAVGRQMAQSRYTEMLGGHAALKTNQCRTEQQEWSSQMVFYFEQKLAKQWQQKAVCLYRTNSFRWSSSSGKTNLEWQYQNSGHLHWGMGWGLQEWHAFRGTSNFSIFKYGNDMSLWSWIRDTFNICTYICINRCLHTHIHI